jgi:hypothetical protein
MLWKLFAFIVLNIDKVGGVKEENKAQKLSRENQTWKKIYFLKCQ